MGQCQVQQHAKARKWAPSHKETALAGSWVQQGLHSPLSFGNPHASCKEGCFVLLEALPYLLTSLNPSDSGSR